MRVKEEMALAKVGGETVEEKPGEESEWNAKGGVDEETTGAEIVERKHGGPFLISVTVKKDGGENLVNA